MNYKKNMAFFVILCVLMALFIFFLYKHYTSEKTTQKITQNLIPFIHDAKKNLKVNKRSVPYSSQGIEYNINFWMFLNDYNYRLNEDKIIIQKGESIYNPTILLEKNSNNMKIIIHTNYFDDTQSEAETESESEQYSEDMNSNKEEFIIENIKLQKWINLNINLIDSNLDVFIDGKLVKSFIVNGYTQTNTGGLNICPYGGFNGYITKLTYTNKSYNPKKIYTIYKRGPN